METSGFPMTHHVMHGFRSHSLALQDILAVRGEIRTLEGRKPLLVFKTSAFNRSATPPPKCPEAPLCTKVAVIFYLRQTDDNGFFCLKSALPPVLKSLDFRVEVPIL